MAEISPLKAWRYHHSLTDQIGELLSPLFDVIDHQQRQALYANPNNSIHLSVPGGNSPIPTAIKTLERWKSDQTIIQDPVPSIYVYYQKYTLPGSTEIITRKGFVANIRVYEWHEKIILRHENTMPHSVQDRTDLLANTKLNVSPTHGLYTDPTHEIETYLDEAMVSPIYETEDYQGVRDIFSVIQDGIVVNRIAEILRDKQIILADGHHRYEGSLEHMKHMRANNPNHHGDEGYNKHLMYFTNTEAKDLRILPTHRLIKEIEEIQVKDLIEKLSNDFIIKPIPTPYDIHEIILGKQWAFGLISKEGTYKIRLKPEKIEEIKERLPEEIATLDLSVLHYYVTQKALGIDMESQRHWPNLSYERSFPKCVENVLHGEHQLGFITNEIDISKVKEICYTGHTMPQKSTYFYPKVICGYLFGSIAEDEQ